MASPALNNGIFLRDSVYSPMGTHFDRAHLSQVSPTKPTDLGIIDLWVQAQKKEAPLYSMSSFGGKNTIYCDSHKFTFRVPTQSTQPYIVDHYLPADEEQVGADGETFQLKLSSRFVGHGAIITYDKYNGAEMVVTPDPIIDGGDGTAIYTFKLVNNRNSKYVEKKYLEPGTYVFRKGSVRDEHSTVWDDHLLGDGGFREFYNYVGEAKAHTHYSVSEEAATMGIHNEVVELWRMSENADPNLKDVKSVKELAGKLGGGKKAATGMKNMIKSGQLSYTWAKSLDKIEMNKIMKDIENYLMWGQGGFVRDAGGGPNDARLPMGLWKQLDNGYKKVYTRDEFSYDMFRAEVYNYFNGKIDWDGPESKRKLQVQTGLGGMELITKMIMKEVRASGLQLNASEIGALSGDSMGLEWGIFADKIKMPFLANLEFVYNAAFDNVHNNPIENPIVEGYPLSSYSYVIFDYNTDQGSDNIVLLKYAPNGNYAASDMRMLIQDGTASYFGGNKVQSSGDFSGYKVKFSMRYPTIFVKDPTKILRFSMKNPITGGSL
jgi:hypothetical protein